MNPAAAIQRGVVFWTLSIAGLCAFLYMRATNDYASDSPAGVAMGFTAAALITALILTGVLRKRPSRLGRFARDIHKPLGALAIGAALAHWHIRGRDYLGLAVAATFATVILSLSRAQLRRYKPLRYIHKYGGYCLILLALLHGVRALFFAGN